MDYRRLGKQRVEAHQLLKALARRKAGESGGWVNHPATLMWEGYEDALRLYMNAAIQEWIGRGYKNTMALAEVGDGVVMPRWLGDADFHASHRSNLLRKDANYYGQLGWSEPPGLPYVWPTGL